MEILKTKNKKTSKQTREPDGILKEKIAFLVIFTIHNLRRAKFKISEYNFKYFSKHCLQISPLNLHNIDFVVYTCITSEGNKIQLFT